ncbi:MAG: hypothetical protein PHF44_04380 [Candidatus Pacebacteria bacterium]|nr:hypothetical protein [Candidatus Paceibacterota bacterium]
MLPNILSSRTRILNGIKLFVIDWEILDNNRSQARCIIKGKSGIKVLKKNKINIHIVALKEDSKMCAEFCKGLKLSFSLRGAEEKTDAILKRIAGNLGISPEEIAFIGYKMTNNVFIFPDVIFKTPDYQIATFNICDGSHPVLEAAELISSAKELSANNR